jgi:bifunctional N-acetylglucosamine-1-phosphate-uridyltransferase/glucosamine-1-phosphate-acetyltransferase GlmU-like protein
MLKPHDFFDLQGNFFAPLFEDAEYVWEALEKIQDYIHETIHPNVEVMRKNGPVLEKTCVLYDGDILDSGFEIEVDNVTKGSIKISKGDRVLEGASVMYAGAVLMDDKIQVGKGCVVEPGALIKGPAILLDKTEVRQGAYIRGHVLVGERCVVGHATEMKNSVMLGESKAGHFAYIGDSLLGKVNLGAGTKLANLKIVESEMVLHIKNQKYETGLRKFGAVLGDGVETGCNSVTSPGTLLGKGVIVYPNAYVRGYYPPKTIIKLKQNQKSRRAPE